MLSPYMQQLKAILTINNERGYMNPICNMNFEIKNAVMHIYLHQSNLTTKKTALLSTGSCADRDGRGAGGPDTPEKAQKYRVPSIIDPDPINHKATEPAFNDGPSSARHH